MSEYKGHIERRRGESTPWWPEAERARPGAPNVVIIYMDDLGYSDPGCYGSEIDTPHIDALGARGQQFTHYTTHPICSPARAALLTGRNAHSVGTGWLSNTNAGFPGYTGEIPLNVPTLAETFRAAGYETLMTGKWHNTPTLDTVPSGPKHNWPTQRGFDTFYGFLEGETHFFFPSRLQQNNQLVAIDAYPQDYYATDDWTDRSIQFIKELRGSSADKPFLLYLAHNAVHAPLQSKSADLAKYSGHYDEGWTELRAQRFHRQLEMGLVPEGTRLPESDPRVPLWQETDPADRKLFARHMETYAAMLDCVDQNLGKLVACLEQLGELDNTIIVFTSDNGEPMPARQRECSITIVGIWVFLRLPSSRTARGLTSWGGRAAYRFIRRAGERCATRPSPRSRPIPGQAADAYHFSCPGRPASRTRALFADNSST